MMLRATLLLLALTLSLPAHAADWLRAASDHYIVHAEMNEAELRDLVQTLEDFGRVLDTVLPGETEPGRKLELYLAPNASDISRVTDLRLSGVGAGAAEMPVAYVAYDYGTEPRFRAGDIFYYLGSYHLAYKFFRPSPVWLHSGFGDFFRTAWRDEQGDFILGQPRPVRGRRSSVSAADVSAALTTANHPNEQAAFERFYDTSAALTAPLLIDPELRGALGRYRDAYVSGANMEEAARTLGDPQALAKLIARRSSARSVPMRRVGLAPAEPAAITITPMQADEIALVELRIERLLDQRREDVSARALALTARHPDSAAVWYEYAASEYTRVQYADFGEKPLLRGFGFANGALIVTANPYPDAEAWRAVNRVLAIDPDHAQAQRLKAEITLARAVRAGDLAAPEEYDAVRALLAPLARDAGRQPLAATLYYQSYIEQGREPPEQAVMWLGQAFIANAGVADVRYAYAVALSRASKADAARSLLTSMLNHPDFAEGSRRALEAAP